MEAPQAQLEINAQDYQKLQDGLSIDRLSPQLIVSDRTHQVRLCQESFRFAAARE